MAVQFRWKDRLLFKLLTRLARQFDAERQARRGRGDAARARRVLERELRTAIEQDQLVLHYQPLAGAGDGKV